MSDAPVVQTSFTVGLNRKLDLLFVIDDSASMAPMQDKLVAQFSAFMNPLKALPSGDGSLTSMADIHLAVVSADTGAGKFDYPGVHCAYTGDSGRFHSQATGACTTTPLMANQTFLAESMDQSLKNYAGDITDAFGCIAKLGTQGCGFGAPLKAARWALDPQNTPAGNGGFLRPDAILAVIVLANQDDCSVPDDSDLFDMSPAGITKYGPFKRFRCNRFGHLCSVSGTLQSPAAAMPGIGLQGCVSNETAASKLTRVADEAAFLKSLKNDPNKLFVAALTGPSTPYALASDSGGDQSVDHSCTQGSTDFADPGVRTRQWIEAFANFGVLQTACANSYAPSLTLIASQLALLMQAPCITSALADGDPTADGLQPICEVVEQYTDDQGRAVRDVLPACSASANAGPCWTMTPNPAQCYPPDLLFKVNRTGALPPVTGAHLSVSCQACVPGVPRIGCP